MTTIIWVIRGRFCIIIRGFIIYVYLEVFFLVVFRIVVIVLDLFKLMGLVSIRLYVKMYCYLKKESFVVKEVNFNDVMG